MDLGEVLFGEGEVVLLSVGTEEIGFCFGGEDGTGEGRKKGRLHDDGRRGN